MATTFPRQYARTQRFTLGAPRAFTVAPDGSRVVFLRSRKGTDRANLLWVREPSTGHEYVAADPASLLGGAAEELSAEERARRERSREGSAGIVGYATDIAVAQAVFALSGRLFAAGLTPGGECRELRVPTPVVDPRLSPDGTHIAYVSGGALRVVRTDGTGDRAVAVPENDRITYGLAEFIAAEEMDRGRGFWWAPDSRRLLVARADDSPVTRWWIADPAHPDREPSEVAYPAAGTPNADVTLHLLGPLDTQGDGGAERLEVRWDRERFPYLARVHWSAGGPPLLLVQARDQRTQLHLGVDTGTGATSTLHGEQDPDWLELFAGVPAWTHDGRLVRIDDSSGARVLTVDGSAFTDDSSHVRAVLDVGEDGVLFSASAGAGGEHGQGEPAEGGSAQVGDVGVYFARFAGDGSCAGVERLTDPDGGEEPGAGAAGQPHVASAVRGGDTLVLVTASLSRPGSRAAVLRVGGQDGQDGALPLKPLDAVPSHAETPLLSTSPRLLRTGERRIPAGLVLPTGYREGDGPLPVLMDPYGGPHGQRVVAAHNAWLTSQWFADQGFAVIVADGRGTPGRSPAWEKAVSRQIADVTLDDQVEALLSLAEDHPLDLTRVGIRGWSYGGYLAALAVLRRPDVFHSAVAGAPVTDWRLYDTHYTERYCGTPEEDPEVYARSSVVTDEGLSGADHRHRPLMLIHGLADDNVAAAHTLRLSSALLAAGRPHEMLPLSGVTHMTPQEQIAENLLLLQVAFFKRTLGVA
ncbi:S9 family peptidase [Streptomyces marispadix]|uniref:Prolyl oligopeptidase family serine peptidase n=1 Tax=Streptomyces marispadix TaxID=2922868 RepID=A0ABS9T1H4_9ACTN|nr:prolyl oligopeptidase family serine peptidase [Streptomyces marispadix]MCH6162378.1 prolyl oligopeptidase family serine peptidase [Streptomyces marispadix]